MGKTKPPYSWGKTWRYLPHDFPPWETVYTYFAQWRDNALWKKINDTLREDLREQYGKAKEPSAAIIDSQTVKTVEKGDKGYDGGKKIKGRKRHILVDTLGLLIVIFVSSADVQDRDGAKVLLDMISGCFSRLKLIFADGGYTGKIIDWAKKYFSLVVEVIKPNPNAVGFEVRP